MESQGERGGSRWQMAEEMEHQLALMEVRMFQRFWRFVFILPAAVLLLAILTGCSSGGQSNSRTPTSTSPGVTSTAGPDGTPSATSTPATACNSQFSDVPLPNDAVQVGKTTTKGATTNCAYRVALDVPTTASFFKNKMSASGWKLLKEQPQGPGSLGQEYFKAQSFVTIILTQHGDDTQTTDIHITVEISK
jgi:hypothetical protein